MADAANSAKMFDGVVAERSRCSPAPMSGAFIVLTNSNSSSKTTLQKSKINVAQ